METLTDWFKIGKKMINKLDCILIQEPDQNESTLIWEIRDELR